MKFHTKYSFLLSLLLFSCGKESQRPDTFSKKVLLAVAGADTTICMPIAAASSTFEAFLDARGSKDESGKIESYAWSQIKLPGIPPCVSIDSPNSAISRVTFCSSGSYPFRLTIADDHGRISSDTVLVRIYQHFLNEYDGLSWDKSTAGLTLLNIFYKPGLIEDFPGFSFMNTGIVDFVNIKVFDGRCDDMSKWKSIPYVPFDSIMTAKINLFYSSGDSLNTSLGLGWYTIYATTQSGIDFSKKLSVGLGRTGN